MFVCPRHAKSFFAAYNIKVTVVGLVSVPIAWLVLKRSGSFDSVSALFTAHYMRETALYGAWIKGKDILRAIVKGKEKERGRYQVWGRRDSELPNQDPRKIYIPFENHVHAIRPKIVKVRNKSVKVKTNITEYN